MTANLFQLLCVTDYYSACYIISLLEHIKCAFWSRYCGHEHLEHCRGTVTGVSKIIKQKPENVVQCTCIMSQIYECNWQWFFEPPLLLKKVLEKNINYNVLIVIIPVLNKQVSGSNRIKEVYGLCDILASASEHYGNAYTEIWSWRSSNNI